MQDSPSAAELLEALAAFISEDVVEELKGRKRFMALVAANVARIVARELELSPEQMRGELADLWRLLEKPGSPPEGQPERALLLELNRELCEKISAGDADDGPWRALLLEHLKSQVSDKLAVTNPKFAKNPGG